ncbi:hypothetical protein ACFVTT_19300 [Streptomyces niveus]
MDRDAGNAPQGRKEITVGHIVAVLRPESRSPAARELFEFG